MRQDGVSSLELIILLACMSVMAAVAVPKPASVSSLAIDYEAACLMSELRRLQDAAQMTPQLHMDFRSLQGIPTPVMTIGMDGYSISEGTVKVRVHQCPADMRIDTDRRTVFFGRNGNGMPTTIRLLYRGQRRIILIDSVGRVRIGSFTEE